MVLYLHKIPPKYIQKKSPKEFNSIPLHYYYNRLLSNCGEHYI